MSLSAGSTDASVCLDIRPSAGTLGAEIRGLDVRNGVDAGTMSALRIALHDYLVLFFPEQHLTIDELKAFGKQWGPLQSDDSAAHVRSKEDPDIVELKASAGYTADIWHTDLTPMRSPPFGSILSMKALPSVGGDTMWSNQYAAYETLSAPIRDLIDNLTAIHEYPRLTERSEHPMVRVHPETGRRFLFVNSQYTTRIVQLAQPESDALLNMLFAHSVQPHFTVRRRWSVGDIAIWENRCTQHYVVNDFSGERIIQRVTVAGEKVEALDSRYPAFQAQTNSLGSKRDAVRPVGQIA